MSIATTFKCIFLFVLFGVVQGMGRIEGIEGTDQSSASVVNRVSKIAEKYSTWALGQHPERHQEMRNTRVTQLQPPPRFYNPAPVKQFFHSVRIQPPPVNIVYHHHHPKVHLPPTTPAPLYSTPFPLQPLLNTTITPFRYQQQVPAPLRLPELAPENRQIFHFPSKPPKEFVSFNPNFPRLLESEVPPPSTQPLFSANSSNLPNHMSQNFGSSILSQLLPPILQEPFIPIPTEGPQISNLEFGKELPKEDVLRIASKKNKFGMPRFNVMRPRGYYQPSVCLQGWCGNECCDSSMSRQFSPVPTTIQAIAMPGSPTPPHPLVLVVHPGPSAQRECSPACQPRCDEQCVARLQYEEHLYNTINEPTCRPDCMPACHVDCLIIPPQQVRCNNFHCQCLAGYVQCAAFTCCMRYPNMAARMKSNVQQSKSSEEEVSMVEDGEDEKATYKRMYTPLRNPSRKEETRRRNDVLGAAPSSQSPKSWTKQPSTQPTPLPCYHSTTTSTTSTTTSTTTPPTTTTTTSTTPEPSTTTIASSTPPVTVTTPTPTTSTPKVLNLTPIYPDMIKDRKVPMIPAYGLWAIPHSGSLHGSESLKRNSVGDIRGRHVIRSENFLDVLSELAQVKLKEDISNDFSQAADIIEFVTENIRKL